MREIGQTLKTEQNLTSADIVWLVGIAKAILRVFVWEKGEAMRSIASDLGISPQTLYTKMRQVVQVLMLVRRGKQSVEKLMDQIRELQDRLAQLEQTYADAQSEVSNSRFENWTAGCCSTRPILMSM